jgi:hypothetical protein
MFTVDSDTIRDSSRPACHQLLVTSLHIDDHIIMLKIGSQHCNNNQQKQQQQQ